VRDGGGGAEMKVWSGTARARAKAAGGRDARWSGTGGGAQSTAQGASQRGSGDSLGATGRTVGDAAGWRHVKVMSLAPGGTALAKRDKLRGRRRRPDAWWGDRPVRAERRRRWNRAGSGALAWGLGCAREQRVGEAEEGRTGAWVLARPARLVTTTSVTTRVCGRENGWGRRVGDQPAQAIAARRGSTSRAGFAASVPGCQRARRVGGDQDRVPRQGASQCQDRLAEPVGRA